MSYCDTRRATWSLILVDNELIQEETVMNALKWKSWLRAHSHLGRITFEPKRNARPEMRDIALLCFSVINHNTILTTSAWGQSKRPLQRYHNLTS